MKPKAKTFDCVAMKRRGAAVLIKKLKDMTPEQQDEFWRRATEQMRQEQAEAIARLEKS